MDSFTDLEITNTTVEDFDKIMWLFEQAMNLKDKQGYRVWDTIDKHALKTEIKNGNQFKVISQNDISCIFSVQFFDKAIWREKDQHDAIYLHRIVVHPHHKGQRLFETVLNWVTAVAKDKNLRFIRMDTWADNKKLIRYYESFGFIFIEYIKTSNTPELPLQHQDLDLALLQLDIYKSTHLFYKKSFI
ncbi:MAG: GNAT family N-acetyltransferase [Ferruginibacter sp.]